MTLRSRAGRIARPAPIRLLAALAGVLVAGATLAGCSVRPAAAPVMRVTSDLGAVTVDTAGTPVVHLPTPFSVDRSQRRVLVQGTGPVIKAGQRVTVDYLGLNGTDGRQILSSFGERPPSFVLDPKQAMPGIVTSLVGATVGSRILAALAPQDAYGVQGQPAAGIGPTDTIVVLLDVKAAKDVLDHATGTPVAPRPGLPTVRVDAAGRPAITLPGSAPPSDLVVQPLIAGARREDPARSAGAGAVPRRRLAGRPRVRLVVAPGDRRGLHGRPRRHRRRASTAGSSGRPSGAACWSSSRPTTATGPRATRRSACAARTPWSSSSTSSTRADTPSPPTVIKESSGIEESSRITTPGGDRRTGPANERTPWPRPSGSAPRSTSPTGRRPPDLQIVDEVVGDGTEARAGMTVSAHYVGVAFSTGEEFDASWNRGRPLDFRLGAGQVIQGWDQGIQGMRVGGRRKITIPPRLALRRPGCGRRHQARRDPDLRRGPRRRPLTFRRPSSAYSGGVAGSTRPVTSPSNTRSTAPPGVDQRLTGCPSCRTTACSVHRAGPRSSGVAGSRTKVRGPRTRRRAVSVSQSRCRSRPPLAPDVRDLHPPRRQMRVEVGAPERGEPGGGALGGRGVRSSCSVAVCSCRWAAS